MSALLAFLATYGIHSTLLLGLAWLATRVLDRPAAAERVWRAALVLSLVSPWLTDLIYDGWGRRPIALALDHPGGMLSAAGLVIPWPALILAIWLGVASLGVLRLVRSHRALLRGAAGRPLPVRGTRGILVTASPAIEVPLVLRGEIYLPERALFELSPAELQAVIAHEAAHLERHDQVWRWLAALSARIFFFQPLNRLAAARLRELSECLCDDRAARVIGSGRALASALATVAGWLRPGPAGLAPTMANADSLTLRRVRRLLSPVGSHRPRIQVLTCGAAVVLLFGAVTAFAPRLEQAQPPAGPYLIRGRDPAGVFTLTVERGRVIDATLDGRPVPASRVRQRGSRLELGEGAAAFSLRLTPRGGITWQARPVTTP
ncbi:MAG TPA: M56 family metallopeptidase [Gemmatimonadales bacterium]|nr:M56 family metallopeptidase [Gemmatimonadales bacterium]